jgi:RNA polymerase sigma-70 factor (ECF subfamily)
MWPRRNPGGAFALAPLGDAVPAPGPGDTGHWERLLAGCRGGDQAATRALLDGIAPTVFRVVCGVFGRRHRDLDDVVQLALIEVTKAIRTYRGECPFPFFASRIALRTAVRAWKDSRARSEREERWRTLSAVEVGEARERGSADGDGRDVRSLGAYRQVWRRLLEELPPAQAETLLLRVILDYSLEETASATGAPFNTVRSRLRLGLLALRRRLDSDPALADLKGET